MRTLPGDGVRVGPARHLTPQWRPRQGRLPGPPWLQGKHSGAVLHRKLHPRPRRETVVQSARGADDPRRSHGSQLYRRSRTGRRRPAQMGEKAFPAARDGDGQAPQAKRRTRGHPEYWLMHQVSEIFNRRSRLRQTRWTRAGPQTAFTRQAPRGTARRPNISQPARCPATIRRGSMRGRQQAGRCKRRVAPLLAAGHGARLGYAPRPSRTRGYEEGARGRRVEDGMSASRRSGVPGIVEIRRNRPETALPAIGGTVSYRETWRPSRTGFSCPGMACADAPLCMAQSMTNFSKSSAGTPPLRRCAHGFRMFRHEKRAAVLVGQYAEVVRSDFSRDSYDFFFVIPNQRSENEESPSGRDGPKVFPSLTCYLIPRLSQVTRADAFFLAGQIFCDSNHEAPGSRE